MAAPTTHKVALTQGALSLLHNLLSGTGWAKTTMDIILAGGLLAEKLPDFAPPPEREQSETRRNFDGRATAWADVSVSEFEISEKERDVCKKAIKHFVEAGAIPATKHAALLLMAFGYGAE